jgi:hypothetical protein
MSKKNERNYGYAQHSLLSRNRLATNCLNYEQKAAKGVIDINLLTMFGLFKKKSEKDKLYDQYEKLMAQSHALSKSNRTESDKKFAEAQEVTKAIEAIEASGQKDA